MKQSDEKEYIFSQIMNLYISGEDFFSNQLENNNETNKQENGENIKQTTSKDLFSPGIILDSSKILSEYGIQNEQQVDDKNHAGIPGYNSITNFAGKNFLMLDKSDTSKKEFKELKQFLKKLKPIIVTHDHLEKQEIKLINFYETGIMHLVSFEDDNDDKISIKISQKFVKEIMKKSQIDTKLYINKIFIFSNKYYDNVIRNIDEIKKIDIAKGISKLMPMHNRSIIDQHLKAELKDQDKLNTYDIEYAEYCKHNFLEQKQQRNEEGDILLFKLKPTESSYQLILEQGLAEYRQII